MLSPAPYIRPAEPAWPLADQLRHLLTMLRAVGMQAGALRIQCDFDLQLAESVLASHEPQLAEYSPHARRLLASLRAAIAARETTPTQGQQTPPASPATSLP